MTSMLHAGYLKSNTAPYGNAAMCVWTTPYEVVAPYVKAALLWSVRLIE